jgi:uracil-DNA glycosylase
VKRAERLQLIERHQRELAGCTRCPDMGKPVVMGRPVVSPVVLVGQAPGDKEPIAGKPFAWTAGKNLFKWFAGLGVDEETFRDNVYMAAVCRCFPGKNPKGGDRVPTETEVANCAPWLEREMAICQPELIIPVGKLAIARFLPEAPLAETIGRAHAWTFERRTVDVIPLPHPSGASTWYHMEPGKALTRQALGLIERHPAWRKIRG